MGARLLAKQALVAVALVAAATFSFAEDYLSPEQFLATAFAEAAPEQKTLWITSEIRERAEQTIGVVPASLRVRYWSSGQRSAWLLDQIGKEKPITLGIVIDAGEITDVQVLAFRETRGGEIRYPFFTDQYRGISLIAGRALSREVDGITGATLSVRAVNRAARLALWLSEQAGARVATR